MSEGKAGYNNDVHSGSRMDNHYKARSRIDQDRQPGLSKRKEPFRDRNIYRTAYLILWGSSNIRMISHLIRPVCESHPDLRGTESQSNTYQYNPLVFG